MILANKFTKWISQNSSPPATFPAKELHENEKVNKGLVYSFCSLRAYFQGIWPLSTDEAKEKDSNLQIQCHIILTWPVPTNGLLQCTGLGVCGRRKRRDQRDRGKCSSGGTKTAKAEAAQGTESLPQAFPGGSTTLSVCPPLAVCLVIQSLFQKNIYHSASSLKMALSWGKVQHQNIACSAKDLESRGLYVLQLHGALTPQSPNDCVYLSSTSWLMVVVACSCAGWPFR